MRIFSIFLLVIFLKASFRVCPLSTNLFTTQSLGNDFRSGFVSILGNPNVGKSSILNCMIGQKISIVSSKPQTTRSNLLGIMTEKNCQIVFMDTPGLLKPKYKLQEEMQKQVVGEGDVNLLVTDCFGEPVIDERVMEKLLRSEVPLIICINKLDTLDSRWRRHVGVHLPTKIPTQSFEEQLKLKYSSVPADDVFTFKKPQGMSDEDYLLQGAADLLVSEAEYSKSYRNADSRQRLKPLEFAALKDLWLNRLPKAQAIIGTSVLHGEGMDAVKDELVKLLQPGPMYYPQDTVTDRSERYLAAELIRESIMQLYQHEVPYSCKVQIDSFRDRRVAAAHSSATAGLEPRIADVNATIFVERTSQKGILIGERGRSVRALVEHCKPKLEEMLQRFVVLRLDVKVAKNWRSDAAHLRKFGQ